MKECSCIGYTPWHLMDNSALDVKPLLSSNPGLSVAGVGGIFIYNTFIKLIYNKVGNVLWENCV